MNPILHLPLGPILAVAGCLVVFGLERAHAAPGLPTGVPEPGLILWGTVVNTTNTSQAINISSASWTVTDGTSTGVYTSQTRPAVRTFTRGDQNFYVLEVPFDTRRFGSIQLDDPLSEGVKSFPLQASAPPTYLLAPTINGVVANVRLIDGAPVGGTNLPVSGFNATVRGRVIRVDLSILPTTESYEQWATRIFGNPGLPNAAPGADPDNDGLKNSGEYAAGTNPMDPTSALRLLQISVSNNQATVGWQSVASKQYVVESAPKPDGPWSDAASILAASGEAQANVTRPPGQSTYYRVRVVGP